MGESEMSIKDMYLAITGRIDSVEKNLEDKLASKKDLFEFKKELHQLQVSNDQTLEIVNQLKRDREADRRNIETLEKTLRARNLIFRGISKRQRPNLNQTINDILNDILKVMPMIRVERTVVVGTERESLVVLVQFLSTLDVHKVLINTAKLKGTAISIERDLTTEGRQRKSKLLAIKRYIRCKLVGIDDKKISIRVIGDQMRIGDSKFNWRNENLWCGQLLGSVKLNDIFQYKFSENEFVNFNFVESNANRSGL